MHATFGNCTNHRIKVRQDVETSDIETSDFETSDIETSDIETD